MALLNPIPFDRMIVYDNYRILLKDIFKELKNSDKKFSYRSFAETANFNSHSYCEFVIKGKRNLTLESIQKIAQGLGFNQKSSSFFKALVLYNQSKSISDREKYFRELLQIRRTASFFKLQEEQYKYYSKWYYPVIRELVVYSNWRGNFSALASYVTPKITTEQARQAFQFLLEKKFLIKKASNKYAQSNPVVSAEGMPEHLTSIAKTEYILRAVESLENQPRPQRHIASSTLAMSEENFKEVSQLLAEVRKKILSSVIEDDSVDNVYALNIQLFPLSNMNLKSPSEKPNE